MEIKRLLCKKVFLVGLMVYLLQIITFILCQTENIDLIKLIEQSQEYNYLIDELKDRPLDESILIVEKVQEKKNDIYVCELKDKLVYLSNYQENMQAIISNARKMNSFSVFQDTESFSYVNALKTIEDFEKLEGIKLALDRDKVTQQVTSFPYLNFFVIGFIGYVIFEIFRERVNGMWELTHSTKKGRANLALSRGFGLIAITICFFCYVC